MIVPGGGLSLDKARWVASRSNFLVHVNVLARLFRGKMLAIVERQSGWESSDNQDENLVSRQWNDGRCSLVWSSTLQHRKQGL